MSVWVKTASTASKLGSLCSQQQMYTKPVVSGDKWFGKEHWVLTAISHRRAGTSVSPASPHTRLMKWYLQAQLQAGLDCEGHDSTQEQPHAPVHCQAVLSQISKQLRLLPHLGHYQTALWYLSV